MPDLDYLSVVPKQQTDPEEDCDWRHCSLCLAPDSALSLSLPDSLLTCFRSSATNEHLGWAGAALAGWPRVQDQSPDHWENDHIMRKYLLLISLGVVFAAPKPQGENIKVTVTHILGCHFHWLSSKHRLCTEFADSSEVELIPPFDSGAGDEGSNPVVIVVKPTSFGDVFAGFPGFGRFPSSDAFPFSGAGGFPAPPHLGLDDIFGGNQEEPLLPSSSNNCGLLCKVG